MPQFSYKKTYGKCPQCGKPVLVPDIRSMPPFCDQKCESEYRFRNGTRPPREVGKI